MTDEIADRRGSEQSDAFPIDVGLVSESFFGLRIDVLLLANDGPQLSGASFRQMNVEQVDGTSQQCKECKRLKKDSEDSSSTRIPMD
jgi:hypothetical protein